MHDLHLLTDITVALVTAFAGGLLARRLGLPTIAGYLLAGMAIGPFTPGFVGDVGDISQLAELGVIFLMFGIGLHFSLRDLWAVRTIAILGAVIQIILVTAVGFVLARFWGWSSAAGLVLGLAVSIASTVVLLRNLADNGLLNTPHGQVAIGWLVLEDLATILILVLLPALLGSEQETSWQAIGLALFKAAIFVALMLVIGARLLPWLLSQIAFTRSRELFILAVVAVAVGFALGSAALFGVSLALGAFLAGVVLGESDISHQIGAEVVPFRDVFTVVFFVSVGMLVNPIYVLANAGQVLALTALIMIGKPVLTVLMGFVLPGSARTMLVAGIGRGQIGEFSFIVSQAGIGLGVLTQDNYSLILAGALISIVLNPLLFRVIPAIERLLQRMPVLWRALDWHKPLPQATTPTLAEHVVVVGAGRVGKHIVTVLEQLGIPRLILEIDAQQAVAFQERGIPTLFGDAANSEVLNHAGLSHARALVVTLPDEVATEMVASAARRLAPNLPIIARAATRSGVQRLTKQGVQDVIYPEFEGGLEVVRHTLLTLGYPATQVLSYTDAVRRDQYDTTVSSAAERRSLDQLRKTMRGMEIVWRRLDAQSPLIGQTLAGANLRARTGASVIVIIRAGQTLPNPKSSTRFMLDDQLGVIGDTAQITMLDAILSEPLDITGAVQRDRDQSDEPVAHPAPT
jgi:monovalent cation:H+ antiporter-2, CPA2 family